jgi:hypothetical protein
VDSSGNAYGYYRDSVHEYGFADIGGTFTTIDAPGSTQTRVTSVDAAGEAAGFYQDSSNFFHGFLYSGGILSPVDITGATHTEFTGINTAGVAFGDYFDTNGQHGFTDNGGTITTFDITDVEEMRVTGVDAAGRVVGSYSDNTTHTTHGFIYSGGMVTTINAPGATDTEITGVDSAGDAVGFYFDNVGSGDHGFVLHNGTFTQIDAENAVNGTQVTAAGADGTIVGFYYDATYLQHSFASSVFGPPTITGTVAGQTTTSEAPVHPFSGVTISDPNSGATDTLTITLSGSGGTLSGAGLSGSGNTYTLAGSASTVTSQLEALSFTPNAGAPNTSSTTTFTLSDQSSSFATPTVDSNTSVVDRDPAPPVRDFNQDGRSDILWRNTGGLFTEWQSTGNGFSRNVYVDGSVDPSWQVASTGDFNGDGRRHPLAAK